MISIRLYTLIYQVKLSSELSLYFTNVTQYTFISCLMHKSIRIIKIYSVDTKLLAREHSRRSGNVYIELHPILYSVNVI